MIIDNSDADPEYDENSYYQYKKVVDKQIKDEAAYKLWLEQKNKEIKSTNESNK